MYNIFRRVRTAKKTARATRLRALFAVCAPGGKCVDLSDSAAAATRGHSCARTRLPRTGLTQILCYGAAYLCCARVLVKCIIINMSTFYCIVVRVCAGARQRRAAAVSPCGFNYVVLVWLYPSSSPETFFQLCFFLQTNKRTRTHSEQTNA